MRPVSDRFAAAIYNSHKVAVEARVLTASGSTPVDILDGTVTLDITADSRGSCDLTLPHEYAPANYADLVTPYGNEIQLFRGIHFPDGERELVSLGIYRIEDVTDDGTDVKVSGIDRSAFMVDALFEQTVNVSANYGTNVVTAIQNMILEAYPSARFRFGTTSTPVPTDRSAIEGNSRWGACQVLAEALGCVVYFDADGYATLRSVPLVTETPVAYVTTGQALMEAEREWSRTDAKNRWIVTGETDDEEPVSLRGEATDDNPSSPTRYGGPFGKVPDFYTNEWVSQDDAQAAHVAAIRKALLAGISQTVPFTSLPNPALEPFDVVRVTRTDAGIDHNVILDAVSIPLSSEGTMTFTTRSAPVAA